MKYLVYYNYGTAPGRGRDEVEANNAEEALSAALASLGTDSNDEEHRYRRGVDAPTSLEILAPQPLNPGQPPDTPPLYKCVGIWNLRWVLIYEATKAE